MRMPHQSLEPKLPNPPVARYLLRAADGKHQPTLPLDPDALHPRNHQGALLPVLGL